MERSMAQPIKIAILAMGGEGGGVLADWIVDLAEHNGWLAQSTSVPGVAQRTGATIYYVELYPEADAKADGAMPVFALMPLPGDVDIVLASELMEAGRAVQRGFVTPDRTAFVCSTHRVYSIAEKIALGDGRVADASLLAHARAAAKRFIGCDMAELSERSGSVISAVLFGVLAGTRELPFSRAQFEATIARGGVGVKPSLKAFDVAYARAAGSAAEAPAVPARTTARGRARAARAHRYAAPEGRPRAVDRRRATPHRLPGPGLRGLVSRAHRARHRDRWRRHAVRRTRAPSRVVDVVRRHDSRGRPEDPGYTLRARKGRSPRAG